jgi:hypothetical protein
MQEPDEQSFTLPICTAILCSGVTYPKVHRIYSLLEVYHRYSSLKQG